MDNNTKTLLLQQNNIQKKLDGIDKKINDMSSDEGVGNILSVLTKTIVAEFKTNMNSATKSIEQSLKGIIEPLSNINEENTSTLKNNTKINSKKTSSSVEIKDFNVLIDSVLLVRDSVLQSSAINAATVLSVAGFGGQITNLASILKSTPEDIFSKLNSAFIKSSKSVKPKISEPTTKPTSENESSSGLKSSKDFLKFAVYSKILKFTMSKIVEDFGVITKDVDVFLKQNFLGEVASPEDVKVLDKNITDGLGKIGEVFKIFNLISIIDVKQYSIANLIKLQLYSKTMKNILPEIAQTFVDSIKIGENVDEKDVKKFHTILTDISKGISTTINSMSSLKVKDILITKLFFNTFSDIIKKMNFDNQEIKAINTFEMSMKGMVGSIFKLWMIQKLVPGAMKALDFIGKSIKTFDDMEKSVKNVRKTGEALTSLAKGLLFFGGSLVLFSGMIALTSPIVIAGLGLLTMTTGVFFMIGKGAKEIKEGSKSILLMSVGLASFAVATSMLSSVLSSSNPLVIMLGLGMLGLSAGLFYIIGKGAKEIGEGSKSVILMSLGLAAFSMATAMMSIVLMAAKPMTILLGFGMLGLSAGLFYLIGKGFKEIALGSLSVGLMGLGLYVFSKGAESLFNSVKDISWEQLGKVTALTVGVTAFIGGLGMLMVASSGIGALAMGLGIASIATIGFALIPFSRGLMELTKVKPPSTEQIIGLGKYVGVVTAGIGAMGAGSLLLLPGSLVALTMGKALKELGSGLNSLKDVNWKGIPIKEVKSVIIGISEAFAAVASDGKTGMSGLLGGVMNSIGLSTNKVKEGIKSVLGASDALKSVASGIQAFSSMTQDVNLKSVQYTDKEGNIKYRPAPGSLGEKIAMALSVVSESFSVMGASGNDSQSFMKFIVGNDFKKSNVEVGINSVMKSGKALQSVATGLMSFDSMTKSLDIKGTYDEATKSWKPSPNSIGEKISIVLGVVNSAFSSIGGSGNTGQSFMKFILGNDFKKSDVEVGINSVLNTGKALHSVAHGLMEFDRLTNNLVLDESLDKSGSIVSTPGKIRKVLLMVNEVFAGLGKSESGDFSLMKLVTGTSFKKSDVEQGISSVKNVGKVLTGIAEGLKAWGNLKNQNIDVGLISQNISKVLTSVSSVFEDIGNKGGAAEPSLLTKLVGGGDIGKDLIRGNPVARGIASIKGLGNEIKNIAEGLKIFNDLKNMGLSNYSFDSKIKGSLMWNIKSVLSVIQDVFSEIGSDTKSLVNFNSLSDPKYTGKTSVEIGIQSIKGVGNELKNIADSVKVFNDIQKKGLDIAVLSTNIKSILTVVKDVFADIGKSGIDDAVKKGIDSIKGVGEELKNIAQGLTPFMDIQKGVEINGKRIPININTLKSNIKDIISMTVDIFAGVGGDSNRWKILFGNSGISSSPTLESIEQGKDIIKEVAEGFEPLSKLIESISKIDGNKWNEQKKVLSDLTLAPINSIKNVIDVVSTIGSDKLTLIMNDIMPKIRMEIDATMKMFNSLGEKANNISNVDTLSTAKNITNYVKEIVTISKLKDDFINTNSFIYSVFDQMYKMGDIQEKLNQQVNYTQMGPIKYISSDIASFMDLTKKLSLTNKQTNTMDTLVSFIERYAKVLDPFVKFSKAYKEHVSDVKNLVSHINEIKVEQFGSFNKLNELTLDIIKTDTNELFTKLAVMKDYLISTNANGNQGQSYGYNQPAFSLMRPQAQPQTQPIVNTTTISTFAMEEALNKIVARLDNVIVKLP